MFPSDTNIIVQMPFPIHIAFRYFFTIMSRLYEVQSGQEIAWLMQDWRQQQVGNHFGVNVTTTDSLVIRLRETGQFYRPIAFSMCDTATS